MIIAVGMCRGQNSRDSAGRAPWRERPGTNRPAHKTFRQWTISAVRTQNMSGLRDTNEYTFRHGRRKCLCAWRVRKIKFKTTTRVDIYARTTRCVMDIKPGEGCDRIWKRPFTMRIRNVCVLFNKSQKKLRWKNVDKCMRGPWDDRSPSTGMVRKKIMFLHYFLYRLRTV